ncbi:MAG: hypothetical protein K8F29_09360 [Kofleriaceae bacterium]|nr:hypothetical protein [Candidatus Methylomirabilis lanthanidiphila]
MWRPNTGVSRRRHTRLLGKVLGVVVVLVGRQSVSAADAVAVRRQERTREAVLDA